MNKRLQIIDKMGELAESLHAIIYLRYLLEQDDMTSEIRDNYILKDRDLANSFLTDCERELYVAISNTLCES